MIRLDRLNKYSLFTAHERRGVRTLVYAWRGPRHHLIVQCSFALSSDWCGVGSGMLLWLDVSRLELSLLNERHGKGVTSVLWLLVVPGTLESVVSSDQFIVFRLVKTILFKLFWVFPSCDLVHINLGFWLVVMSIGSACRVLFLSRDWLGVRWGNGTWMMAIYSWVLVWGVDRILRCQVRLHGIICVVHRYW
jgi:hypothetical protein